MGGEIVVERACAAVPGNDPGDPAPPSSDTVPMQAFLEATRAGASQSFAGGGTRLWLMASNLELPKPLVNVVARQWAPGLPPEEMLRPH